MNFQAIFQKKDDDLRALQHQYDTLLTHLTQMETEMEV